MCAVLPHPAAPAIDWMDVADGMQQDGGALTPVAAIAPLVTWSNGPDGVRADVPTPNAVVDVVLDTFLQTALGKCWMVSGPMPFMLCHSDTGWRIVRVPTEPDLQDAYLILNGVAPTAALRVAVPWNSVPGYSHNRELVGSATVEPVPALLVPIALHRAFAAGATVVETAMPMSPTRAPPTPMSPTRARRSKKKKSQ